MRTYNRNIEFSFENKLQAEERIDRYLTYYNFQRIEKSSDSIVYARKNSLLADGWTINPLKWNTEIRIIISSNRFFINYKNEGNGQITPLAFSNLFDNFLKNLKLSVLKGISVKEENKREITSAKKRIIAHGVVLIICGFFGLSIGYFFDKLIGVEFLSILLFPLGLILSQSAINLFIEEKLT
ncbi:hypothetical protein [Mesonia maritima]|uniref:Uncharacterized protein n=1 Tax=Mesonia maritima TaxID=1793873 RepID=A0ABU1K429_9FLAO|nr:hypothetical protein [Mesonia maritima]MDR6300368.1 hypothetical protein [Mesonia maritima]